MSIWNWKKDYLSDENFNLNLELILTPRHICSCTSVTLIISFLKLKMWCSVGYALKDSLSERNWKLIVSTWSREPIKGTLSKLFERCNIQSIKRKISINKKNAIKDLKGINHSTTFLFSTIGPLPNQYSVIIDKILWQRSHFFYYLSDSWRHKLDYYKSSSCFCRNRNGSYGIESEKESWF